MRIPSGKPTVTGYQASENLTVTLRDTKAAGAVIAAASAAGGNATQISGLSTDLQNNSGPLSQARDAAFNDAKAKADAVREVRGAQPGPGGAGRGERQQSPNPATCCDRARRRRPRDARCRSRWAAPTSRSR